MKILSVNISKPTSVFVKGKEIKTGYFKNPVEQAIYLGKTDVTNDSVIDRVHHGGLDKACYLYGYNHYKFWKTKYPNLEFDFGMFGENITVENLDETRIKIGDIFKVGDAKIQVSQPRQPCYKMGLKFKDPKIVNTFRSTTYSGIYVRVLTEGFVKKGDTLDLIEKDENAQTVSEIFKLIYSTKPENADLEKAISNPFLADHIKEKFTNKFKL